MNFVSLFSAYATERRERLALLVDHELSLAHAEARRAGARAARGARSDTCAMRPIDWCNPGGCAGESAAAANADASASKASLQRYEAGIAYICHEVRS